MYHKTIFHTLEGEVIKFTIRDRILGGEVFYYANLINTDLELYQRLSEWERETNYGMEMSNGQGQTVYYRNPDRLVVDIIEKYGDQWLESEW